MDYRNPVNVRGTQDVPGVFEFYVYQTVVKDFTDFRSAMSRKQYWMATLLTNLLLGSIFLGLWCTAYTIEWAGGDYDGPMSTGIGMLGGIAYFIYGIMNISMVVRRLRDAVKSPLWIFVAVVPFVGWLALLVMLCIGGNEVCPATQRNKTDKAMWWLVGLMFALAAAAIVGSEIYISTL